MHIANADDLIHIHVVVPADTAKLVGKGDVHGAEGVLNDLGHFGSADVGDDNFALAEGGVILLLHLADSSIVSADGAVVM